MENNDIVYDVVSGEWLKTNWDNDIRKTYFKALRELQQKRVMESKIVKEC